MATNTTCYDVGDLVRLGVTITTTSGGRRDTGMTLRIHRPATASSSGYSTSFGPITQPGSSATILRTTTGVWKRLWKIDRPGRHTYQWLSTGTVTLSTGGAFTARKASA